MVIQCFLCTNQLFDEVKQLIRHLKYFHSLTNGAKVVCTVCSKDFYSFQGLTYHINSHNESTALRFPLNCALNYPVNNNFANDLKIVDTTNVENINPDCSFDMSDEISKIVARMLSLFIPKRSITLILTDLSAFLLKMNTQYELNLEEEFNKVFSGNLNVDDWLQHLSLTWAIPVPIQINIGNYTDLRLNKRTGQFVQKHVSANFVYVPLLDYIKFLFNNSSFKKLYFSENKQVQSHYMCSFRDGSKCKENLLFSSDSNTIQVNLFYDDFEPCNPIGHYSNINKLGAIYFTIGNLPRHVNSLMKNIHLLALFYTQDIKKFGFSKILDPIISDFKKLETDGIKVDDKQIYGTISLLSADNLGYNCILGFVQSFSANNFCRICTLDKESTQTTYREVPEKLRSINSYNNHLHEAISLQTPVLGVKEESLLNNLQFFNGISNNYVDAMHDILEGVLQYEMKLFLQWLINSNICTEETIVQQIHSYDYGKSDIKNKPRNIKIFSKSNDLGLSAAQAWCLSRYLLLILAKFIDYDQCQEHVDFLVSLLHINCIIFSPKVTVGLTYYLATLIEEHLTKFVELFPEKRLIPKQHFLIHYPRIMREFGPLTNFWAMRFESKHYFFSRLINNVKCFKNLPKTLTERHQLAEAFIWVHDSIDFKRIELSSKQIVTLNEINNIPINDIDNFELEEIVEVSSSGKIYGLELYKNCFLYIGNSDDLPIFGRLDCIIVSSNKVFVLVKRWITEYLSSFYNAYSVIETDDYSLILFDELETFIFDLHCSTCIMDNCNYIVPRHIMF